MIHKLEIENILMIKELKWLLALNNLLPRNMINMVKVASIATSINNAPQNVMFFDA